MILYLTVSPSYSLSLSPSVKPSLTSQTSQANLVTTPSTNIAPTPTTSSSIHATSSRPALPSQSPLPHTKCRTGPDFIQDSNRVSATDFVFLDLSEPVNCSGVITRWNYCHIVIAYRTSPGGLWPCVWRQANDSENFELVGCNKFTIIPGNGSRVRCRYFVPSLPSQFLRVEAGDYIGFYVPDSGLFIAFSTQRYDNGHFQLKRNESGFSPYITYSELVRTSSTPGRALLSAEIGMNTVLYMCKLQ